MDDQSTMFAYMMLAVIVLAILGRNQVGGRTVNTRPAGYIRVPRDKISNWTKWQARERMYVLDEFRRPTNRLLSNDYRYFNGKNYRYAVYYKGDGSYIVYSQKKW